MTNAEIMEYKKAYVELYEIIKRLNKQEKEKIPEAFVENLIKEMDKEYFFVFDDSKEILNQNIKVETKALLVKLYERYLAPTEKKEFWNRYDKLCLNKIEEEKKKRFSTDNLLNSKQKHDRINDKEMQNLERRNIK